MDPQLLVFLFLFLGLVLIFAELFVPSGGAIGVICACCFLASGYYAYIAWYKTYQIYWWLYLCSEFIIVPATIVGAFQVLMRSPLGDRIRMPAPTPEEVTPYLEEQARLQKLIGQRGKSLNLMTPGGMVLVNGERLHASSEGLMIEADQPVEVVAVRGTRIVVKLAEAEATRESAAAGELHQLPDPLDPFLADDATT